MTVEVTNVINQVVTTDGNTVINTVNETAIYESTMGPQGIQGPDSNEITKTAGEAISALKVVYVNPSDGKVYKASKDTASTVETLIGVAETAASQDSTITIRTYGEMTDSNWSWSLSGSRWLYLSTNGAITQTAPTSGVVRRIGFVMAATKIFVQFGEAIVTV